MGRVELDGFDQRLFVVEAVDALDGGEILAGVLRVQSPVAATMSMGRGAMRAPSSTLNVSMRRPGAFSHGDPPCMMPEIMLTGAEPDAIVDGGEEEGLGAAAGGAGGVEAGGIDVGERLDKIGGADGVSELFFHVAEGVGGLFGVVVADHIVVENAEAHPGEHNGAGGDVAGFGLFSAPLFPMAVGAQDGRMAARCERAVEISAEPIAGRSLAGRSFDEDFFDGEAGEAFPAENLGAGLGAFGGERVEAGGGEDLGLELEAASLPLLAGNGPGQSGKRFSKNGA